MYYLDARAILKLIVEERGTVKLERFLKAITAHQRSPEP